jgi:hypothetical protein
MRFLVVFSLIIISQTRFAREPKGEPYLEFSFHIMYFFILRHLCKFSFPFIFVINVSQQILNKHCTPNLTYILSSLLLNYKVSFKKGIVIID